MQREVSLLGRGKEDAEEVNANCNGSADDPGVRVARRDLVTEDQRKPDAAAEYSEGQQGLPRSG